MARLITIINPSGTSTRKRVKKTSTKKGKTMARRKRSTTRRKRAYRRVARRNPIRRRRRARRRNYWPGESRRHATASRKGWQERSVGTPGYAPRRGYKKKRGWKKVTKPQYRRNPARTYRRRRRRNPAFKLPLRQYFNRSRMTRAGGIVVGIGAGAFGKQMLGRFMPPMLNRFYGALAIVGGAMLNSRSRKVFMQSAGTGVVAYGLLDLIVSNVPMLGRYFPTISAPSLMGTTAYGRSMYGAQINANQNVDIVGANISANQSPEIVGDDDSIENIMEQYA